MSPPFYLFTSHCCGITVSIVIHHAKQTVVSMGGEEKVVIFTLHCTAFIYFDSQIKSSVILQCAEMQIFIVLLLPNQ